MKKSTVQFALLLGTLCLWAMSTHATTIRSTSSYGSGPVTYTEVSSQSLLTNANYFLDSSSSGGFDQEIVCPFSVGCSGLSGEHAQLFLTSITTLTPGTEITIDLGSTTLGSSFDPPVSLVMCTSDVFGIPCMTTTQLAGTSCITDSGVAGDQVVTIDLSSACPSFPSTLVFSIEEAQSGASATFATVTTATTPPITTPEPGSLILLSTGLLSLVGLYGWQRRKQSLHDAL